MCWWCYDVDKRALAMPKSSECDGVVTQDVTMGELMQELTMEWGETGKTHYRFFKAGFVSTPANGSHSWFVNQAGKESKITVDFV